MIRRPALHFDREFTIMPNAWVRDPRTSLATKGLLAQLLSHAPGWQVSIESLVAANPEGRHAIRTCIAQAREAGYLAVAQQRDQGGRFAEANYDLVDPFTQPEESAGSDAGLSGRGAGHPSSENPTSVDRTHKKNIFQEEHLEECSTVTADAATPTKTDRHRLLGAIQTIATLVAQHVHNEDPHRGEEEVESALDDLYALGADIYGEDPFEYGINFRGWTITAREQDRYAAGTWLNKYLAWHRNEA